MRYIVNKTEDEDNPTFEMTLILARRFSLTFSSREEAEAFADEHEEAFMRDPDVYINKYTPQVRLKMKAERRKAFREKKKAREMEGIDGKQMS